MQIGEGSNMVGEVYRIIPQLDMVGNAPPINDIVHKGSAPFIFGDRLTAIQLNGTQHDLNVAFGNRDSWGLPAVLISQG